ncbi:MAG: hypothetical protein M1831_004959 [Alyxoria varia]|nr:MAG: hypothetical protein M1831_004959 [Alyxoria varia]
MAHSTFPGRNPFSTNQGMHSFDEAAEDYDQDITSSPSSRRTRPVDMDTTSRIPPVSFSSAFGGGDFDPSSPMPPLPGSDLPHNYSAGRRTSVSAESMNPADTAGDNWKPPFFPKTTEQEDRLRKAVAHNFLFSHLDDEQTKQVLGALQEAQIPAKGIKIISQGDAGDYFYVIEKGSFDVHISSTGKVESGPDGMGNKVAKIPSGGSFGELALMYNHPRAATVVSTEPSTLWKLDRMTFRQILMGSSFQRRQMYESFLSEVDLLEPLHPYERTKIADALNTEKYPPGHTIIREGDPGESFFLVESGELEVYKSGIDYPVHTYGKGGYFGELALLNDKPRAASVVSKTEVKLATLGKEGFQRLLGPVEQIMRRNDPSRQAAG